MGALTAYVRVRLCCSLCHHGRHAHRSLPRRNRRIYGCTLPVGTNERRRGMEGSGYEERGNRSRGGHREIKIRAGSQMIKQCKRKNKVLTWDGNRWSDGIRRRKGRCSRAGRRAREVSSPPPIGEFGCSDVWLAVKADRQLAANDMCCDSSQRWANDRRGEAGRWLPSGKYTCITVPVVWAETAWTFGDWKGISNG